VQRRSSAEGMRLGWSFDHSFHTWTDSGLPFVLLAGEEGVVCGRCDGDVAQVEAGWAGLTLDMRENVQSVGKLSDCGDIEIIGVGHGEPIAQGGIEVLKRLREQKVS
jgi:hypothetical protein